MRTLFKLILLITVQVLHAQKPSNIEMEEIHTIYDESFTTDANTTLVLNLSNTAARIYKSKDDKVHIKYTMEFNNYRKKIVESSLKRAIVSGKKENNKITYTSKSRNSKYYRQYQMEEVLVGRLGKMVDSTNKIKPVIRKSLDSILIQINLSERKRLRKFYGTFKIKPRVKKWKKSDKLQITRMVIYIPENIHVRATLENAQLIFLDDFINRATINSRNSKLRFKTIGHELNIFDIDNGYFNAEAVTSGSYSFANTKEVTIGRLSNSLVNSEFTKIELGEIGKNNKVVDFNSKYFIYNFSNDFGAFNLDTDYTEVNLFFPESIDYYIETFGYDTVHYSKGFTGVIGSPSKYEPTKMMTIGKETNPNKIKINTTHGIIRLGEDSIDFGKKN
ncbi:hypothetical protein [Winogradskyella sp. UBA3174]|uniref:hypothetical protein n=1 Tax=Winogradskyella sp. UBA3174 TaxID=1947785 RepID=UPI0025FAFB63|nr:hypothetical protein [Winogradskyella sp. UBA3174]|tara:strand:+ start:23194 stop:24363 length:1170 start_codon:yes stop_codon:yes gene_type:complete